MPKGFISSISFAASWLVASKFTDAAAFVPSSFLAAKKSVANRPRAQSILLQAEKAPAVDAVRYKSSDPKGSCDDVYDTIVIGSGIGGLTTASLLAQSEEKQKVLVLEQHSTVCGGCCHTFQRKGYKFPTGIHYIGDMEEGSQLKRILDSLTPENDTILWDPNDEIYDEVVLGSGPDLRRYQILGGQYDAQAEHLKKQFPPDTHNAIDKYYALMKDAWDSYERAMILKSLPLPLTKMLRMTGLHRIFDGGYRKYASKSLAEVVNSLTDNEDLRAVMCYNWDNYGCEPSRSPFVMHSVIVSHYKGGAFFPRGGPDQIPKKIIPSITAMGGAVLANAPVKEIIVDSDTGRASGVMMMDGRIIQARKAVISDAGVVNTLSRLLPKTGQSRGKLIQSFFGRGKGGSELDHLHNGASGLTLFVGLKGDHDDDFKLPHSQQWVYPDASVEQYLKELRSLTMDEANEKLDPKDIGLLFIASSSAKDSTWKDRHPGRTTLEILTGAPWEWFQEFVPGDGENQHKSVGASDPGGKPGSHGQKYKEAKAKLSEKIWSRVVDVLSSHGAVNLPQSLDMVDHYELGTPLTYAHFYWSEGGAFYGLDHDINRFKPRNVFERLRPEVREVPGLFLTGQDINSCGFGGAMIGGVLCAGKVLGLKNPFSAIEDIHAFRAKNRVQSQGMAATGESWM